MTARPGPFHIVSPLLESAALSKAAGAKVYMKLENVQPTGSFKIRGIGHMCQEAAKRGCRRFVCSSGSRDPCGAARRVVVPGGRSLLPAPLRPVFLPVPGLPGWVSKAKGVCEEGGDGRRSRGAWQHWGPTWWWWLILGAGRCGGCTGDLLVVVVVDLHGSGTHLVMVGCGGESWWWWYLDVPVVAAETWGAHSLHAALQAGRLVSLPDITSVAKCLGARRVSARALQCAQELRVVSQVVEDAEAVRAVEQFLGEPAAPGRAWGGAGSRRDPRDPRGLSAADDERLLVEPACGAALALLYTGRLQRLRREGRLGAATAPVVVIVCGGSSVDAAELRALKSRLGLP
ncbi:SDSL protein, partial [Eudromia elegans]|nr:SDSL protein [Eudromia elegans]